MQAPRGMRDVLPGEVERWQALEARVHEFAARYGFREIRTPVVEHTEVFQRTVGEATDIVEKEMYTFADRSGRSLSLRPEGTAAVVRAVLEHGLRQWPQPLKLYYVASMFRYDRPQKGRYRQHTQFGAEIIGSPDPAADAEVLTLPVRFLQALGLAHVEVRLNSVGDAACRPRYLEALRAYFRPHLEGLCADCQRRFAHQPLRLLECKQDRCRRVAAGAPAIFDLLCAPCAAHFAAVRTYLETLGIPYVLDPFIVRGMDYYTRTAFEVYSGRLGAQNAVFGGGRYDGLAEQLGGAPTPGVGFGLGLDRLLLVLEQEELLPAPAPGVEVMVVTIGETARPAGLRLADELRAAGRRVEVDLLGRDVRAQMRHAHRLGVRVAVLLGDAELAAGTVTVRTMATGQQETVARDALPALLHARLDGEVTP